MVYISQDKLIKGYPADTDKKIKYEEMHYIWEDFPFESKAFLILSVFNSDSIFSIPFSKSKDRSYLILFMLIL